ncbi:recombination regulator RecX [Planococcus lenghuensis]|uniref:Regulatory protein RecX n=1 Tax=Planococcus lenghuensis TaxID=2213202 RepID=A0A1Q2KWG7_9BACL|nr:recombination regulator RecX [Planococcus lenghuensis]AQQ52493.1 recombination regulator RecX [Planococcus lenghuensis]
MPIITKITQQKNNQERYNVFLDEKFAFGVEEGILVRYQLTKGKELDQWTIEEMVFDDQVSKAFNKALTYLSFRMRSEGEVRKKLRDAEYGEAVIDEAVKKLYKLNFLDDRAFSEALLNTQVKTSKKGPRAIRQDLQRKGIDKEVQQEVLDEYSEEVQFDTAKVLADKIADRESRKTPVQIKQKINDALLRKGFSYTVISQVVDTLDLEKDEEQWEDMVAVQGDKLWDKHSRKLSGGELKMKVKQGLYQKGFPADVISQYVEQKERNDE